MIEYNKRKFHKLYKTLMTKNRYIFDNDTKNILNDIRKFMNQRIKTLAYGTKLWRAQIGCDFDKNNDTPTPYNEKRMYPLKHKAFEGRANPKGIPYVYLATNKDIAINEIRPWPGKFVSCGTFLCCQDLKLVDFTKDENKSLTIDLENMKLLSKNSIENLWGDLNTAFSKPVIPADDTAEYVITQVIAELVKNEGLDGILYKSGYSNKHLLGKNVVLFNRKGIKLKTLDVYKIETVKFKYTQQNNTIYVLNNFEP
ncbi:RES family NAD+ phosphorylase [Crassaminicella profunda]|uniref:RES family NAD+ phosphorylase n=1 Tax=Crassaminicella profunda TaxID=1286698 RepID=UPI001CA660A0|nr:RES family NAD+ phosphorylase [Crassaminicella profunda]QZY56673.1 RES family NAD+ phosphorylase [Crassaminicella profunda]